MPAAPALHDISVDRRVALGLALLLFVSFAYFYQGGGWNECSRMDLVRALVEDHTLSIDHYHRNTGDKASFGGHFYSDKAPGVSFLAAPIYAVLTPLSGLFGSEHDFIVVASWLVTAIVVGGATTLTAVLLYFGSRHLGASPRAGALTALAYGLGTTAFPLSTMLFSHQVAAAALFGAFSLLWYEREHPSQRIAFAAGLVGAGAVAIEFPTAPVLLVLLAYHARSPRRLRAVLPFLAGAAVPALFVALYLLLAFDSPFQVGYGLLADATGRSGMLSHGVFGVTYPKLTVLGQLLVGRYRGLLPYSPVLLLAAAGLFRMRPSAERNAAVAVVVYYLLFVASYEWWEGGSSFGSRHLAPMLPFLCLPLGRVADALPKVTTAAAVVSIGFMSIVTAVQPKPSERIRDPFFGGIWPAFVDDRVALGNVCPFTGKATDPEHRPLLARARGDAFNVGMLIGGSGRRSLVPLLGYWLGCAFMIGRLTAAGPQRPTRAS